MPMNMELFQPFLASPHSHDIIPGQEKFKVEIDQQIIGIQVIVVVGTCNLKDSKLAMREIRLARQNGKRSIVFLQEGCSERLPKILYRWNLIECPTHDPDSKFDALRFHIVSTCLHTA